jgi:type IV secretory pathway TraG/TraD family ATPase VirD4
MVQAIETSLDQVTTLIVSNLHPWNTSISEFDFKKEIAEATP